MTMWMGVSELRVFEILFLLSLAINIALFYIIYKMLIKLKKNIELVEEEIGDLAFISK